MAITAAMVKELREKSGAGMMDCKKALTETDGDMDKAVDFLRENLEDLGFYIEKEDMAYERGKYYHIFKVFYNRVTFSFSKDSTNWYF